MRQYCIVWELQYKLLLTWFAPPFGGAFFINYNVFIKGFNISINFILG